MLAPNPVSKPQFVCGEVYRAFPVVPLVISGILKSALEREGASFARSPRLIQDPLPVVQISAVTRVLLTMCDAPQRYGLTLEGGMRI